MQCLSFFKQPAFRLISEFYGKETARRSKVSLINHITEGLQILDAIQATEAAKSAYCIHPLVQSNDFLIKHLALDWSPIEGKVLLLAMEYRAVANNYLSTRIIDEIQEINLSPLFEVNQMLIADKVQNRKDFELYHKESHPRSKDLQKYFSNWLKRLDISEEYYQTLVEQIT